MTDSLRGRARFVPVMEGHLRTSFTCAPTLVAAVGCWLRDLRTLPTTATTPLASPPPHTHTHASPPPPPTPPTPPPGQAAPASGSSTGSEGCPAPAPGSSPSLPPLGDLTPDTLQPFLAVALAHLDSPTVQAQALEDLRTLVPREGLPPAVAAARCVAAAASLDWLRAVLGVHGSDVGLTDHVVFLLRRITWGAQDRAPLLGLVPMVVQVLGVHGGEARVVQNALAVLANLAMGQGDQVRARFGCIPTATPPAAPPLCRTRVLQVCPPREVAALPRPRPPHARGVCPRVVVLCPPPPTLSCHRCTQQAVVASAVPTAAIAMDAHWGVPVLVETGLLFLANLAADTESKVMV